MQLTLKSRPMLHSRIHLQSVCQPMPLRSTTAAAPSVIRATPNERPIGPESGGQRKQPPRGGDDEPTVGRKAGHSLGKVPAGGSQLGRGKSSKRITPRRNGYQKNGTVTASPAQLNRLIMACRDLTSLDQVIKGNDHSFDERHVATAMNRIAMVHDRKNQSQVDMAQRMMQDLSVVALHQVNCMDARCLSSVLWALGSVGGWIYFAATKLPGFNAQDLSNSLWAFAKLGIEDDAFTAALLSVAERKLPGFNAQELSNSLWASAKLGIEDDAFIAALLSVAKLKLPDFEAQSLSNSLWAIANLGIKDDAFIAALLRVAKRKLPDFDEQALSNSLWAIAKLDIEDDAFTAALLSVAKRKLPDFTAQALSNSLWAAAKLGIEDEAFVATWLSVARRKLAEFNSIDLRQVSTSIASRDKWNIDKGFKDRIAARSGNKGGDL
eukprot:gene30055-biopygen15914